MARSRSGWLWQSSRGQCHAWWCRWNWCPARLMASAVPESQEKNWEMISENKGTTKGLSYSSFIWEIFNDTYEKLNMFRIFLWQPLYFITWKTTFHATKVCIGHNHFLLCRFHWVSLAFHTSMSYNTRCLVTLMFIVHYLVRHPPEPHLLCFQNAIDDLERWRGLDSVQIMKTWDVIKQSQETWRVRLENHCRYLQIIYEVLESLNSCFFFFSPTIWKAQRPPDGYRTTREHLGLSMVFSFWQHRVFET